MGWSEGRATRPLRVFHHPGAVARPSLYVVVVCFLIALFTAVQLLPVAFATA
jgi:hypothetical protein